MESIILVNSIRTPDGTVLTSKHRHDYVTHTDKNGEMYMVDGGSDYLRRSVNEEEAEDLTVTSDSPIEDIRRDWFRWNERRNEYVKIQDIDDDWLDNIIEWYQDKEEYSEGGTTSIILSIFKREREYRLKN